MNRTLNSFNNLSERNISDLINNSAKKSCVLDPMPTCLIYDSVDVLLPVITRMVNASLSMGHFPDEWKEAVVSPLLKKGAKDSGHKNLPPVSNLQFVSRITERADLCPHNRMDCFQNYNRHTEVHIVQRWHC